MSCVVTINTIINREKGVKFRREIGHATLKYRKFNNFDSTSFRHDIFQQNWNNTESCTDPNSTWAAWKQLFLECVNKHAPLCEKRTRAIKSPWITPHLKKRKHDRDILKRLNAAVIQSTPKLSKPKNRPIETHFMQMKVNQPDLENYK